MQSLYSVAGAPAAYNSFNRSQTRGGRSYQASMRDQGACDSCVAQAIAAAMEASVASTLQQDASAFNVSAPTLYYCTQGWRSCKTGWDIRQALAQVVDEAPWLVRPTSCASARTELTTPTLEPEISSWASICAASLAQRCPPAATGATPAQQQWLKCSFRALSTFAEIQAAIRMHGSVVTRMTVYNDFGPFFSGNNSDGFVSQPYKVTKGARPLFGHAVIITGYDNDGYTWTVQNSWGCSGAGCPSAATAVRRPGVTKDGRFRIRMGEAGVGAPGQTFAVACEPALFSAGDLHSARPWRVRKDMPLQLLRPADVNDLSQGACFSYRPSNPSDTPAAIADAFQLDIRQLARDNPSVFPVINGSLLIRSAMEEKQMADIIKEVNAEAPVRTAGAITLYFRCRTYNGPVIGRPKECRADAGGFAPCAGLSPCWLYFPQHDLAASIQGKALKVCNISATVPADRPEDRVVPYFANTAARQGRALKALLQVIGVKRGDSARPLKDVQVPASLEEQCNTSTWLPSFVAQEPGSMGSKGTLYIDCNSDGRVIFIHIGLVSSARTPAAMRETDMLVNVLLALKDELQGLTLYVSDGQLPPQLGELHRLWALTLAYDCMSGHLPPHLVAGLPQLDILRITPSEGTRNDVSCGITGPIPPEWSTVRSPVRFLKLSANRLSGTLPSFQNWRQMEVLDLSSNGFTGPLPASWARLPSDIFERRTLNFSSNALEGVFPYEWSTLSIFSLDVSDNPNLRGCIPLDANTDISFDNTGITGRCGRRQEAAELAALQRLLPKVFNPAAAPNTPAWTDALRSLLADLKPGLRAIIPPGAESGEKNVQAPTLNDDQSIPGEVSISVAVINGTAHVTKVWASKLAGIDLRHLPDLVSRLPQLQSFWCYSCHCKASLGKGACALPPNLAEKAPTSLTELILNNINGMATTLPPSWGNWTTLHNLDLSGNKGITGPLPDAWSNMASLKKLGLGDCVITGTLPPSWGAGPMAKTLESLRLYSNRLLGTIPFSWGGFKQAYVALFDNPTMDWDNSCIPDGCVLMVTDGDVPSCSAVNISQAGTLASIKGLLLQPGSSQPDKVLPTWVDPGGADVNTPPNYCTKWRGVTCDGANNVVGLQLSGLPASVDLNALADLLLKLPKLSTLELSRVNLTGNLSSPSVAHLVMQLPLQHLNLSGNPGIVGKLPDILATASDLQSLDLSGCGMAGPLPPMWMVLQQLRVLRLAAAGGQGGQLQSTLPGEWGLLTKLNELDISGQTGITGSLPAAWVDAAAMQAVVAAAASAAADRAAKAEAALAVATRQGARAEVAAASAGGGSWSAAQQYEQVTAAAREAAAAKRVLAALQAASAGGNSDDVSAASTGVGLGMRQLQVLRLAGCSLSGGLPASFAGLQLRELDLSRNTGLGGQLPPQWGTLTALQSLRLVSCSLTGGVPATFVTLAGLTALDLSDNKLGGTLPAAPFASLGKLAFLNLSSNAFEGPLPPLWRGMRGAEVIDVSRNGLNGTGFPSEWGVPVAGNALKLQQLRLSPGNPCMDVSNATVVEASGGACSVVTSIAAARAANRQGKCAVVYTQQPGGCVP